MKVDHNDIVQRLHREQSPSKTIDGALDFTLRVIAVLPASERAGLLRKEAGENIVPHNGVMVSAGRICYPDGQLYKVLTDIPATNGPQWLDNGIVDPSFYVAVERNTPPAPLPPPPPEPEPPADDVLAQLLDLFIQVGDSVTTIAEATVSIDKRLERLETGRFPVRLR